MRVLLVVIVWIFGSQFVHYTRALSDGDVRLMNGSDPLRGRVEIFYNQTWGMVCDDQWDLNEASVVCRQLGHGAAVAASGKSFFGRDSSGQPTHLNAVQCEGYESALVDCKHGEWGGENCSHKKGAGVVCSRAEGDDEGDLRLVGNLSGRGRLEIFSHGRWGTLCSRVWRQSEATLVCGQLGYLAGAVMRGDRGFGPVGKGQPHYQADVDCSGRESSFAQCLHSAMANVEDCSGLSDAWIVCSNEAKEASVRLVAGSGKLDGRVEVFHDGDWGTVCGRSWNFNDALVVCRELGLGPALASRNDDGLHSFPADPDQPVLLRRVACRGNETAVRQCPRGRWDAHAQRGCAHSEDAGVECLGQGVAAAAAAAIPKDKR